MKLNPKMEVSLVGRRLDQGGKMSNHSGWGCLPLKGTGPLSASGLGNRLVLAKQVVNVAFTS